MDMIERMLRWVDARDGFGYAALAIAILFVLLVLYGGGVTIQEHENTRHPAAVQEEKP